MSVRLPHRRLSKTPREEKQRVQLRDFIEALQADDVEALPKRTVLDLLQTAQKLIEDQAVEIQHLRKQLFGQRSEKVSKDQLSLFTQILESLVEQSAGAPSEEDETGRMKEEDETGKTKEKEEEEKKRKKKKAPTKRRPLKPTRTEIIPVPDEERTCPECGEARETIAHVPSMVVEYVPAKVEVIEFKREKIACRHCEGHLAVAPTPKERVVERALPGPQLLSAWVTEKVVDGLPLRRVHKRLKRAGLDIPLRTLNRWEGSPIRSFSR